MIRVLGTKRILILVFMLALNVALSAVVYLFLMPDEQAKTIQLQQVTGNVSTVRSDINRMQIEFEQLADEQHHFDKLKADGFFNAQERNQAEKVFKTIEKQAGVVSAIATIKAGVVEDNAEAAKADYKVLSSPVSIHVEAMDGVDIFRYIYLLQRFFPGEIAVESIMMERKSEVNGTVLRSIASGSNPVLVDANIDVTWRTMIPKADVVPPAGPSQGGGT